MVFGNPRRLPESWAVRGSGLLKALGPGRIQGMNDYASVLRWTDQQRERMRGLVTEWASINSGSYHVGGLGKLSESLQHHFSGLGCEARRVALPPQQVI